MNRVILIGRTTKDIELRYTTSDMAIAKFSLAINRKLTREKREELESKNLPTADFIRCVAFNKIAETIGKYVKKGNRIAIEGHIQTGSYEKDGQMIYTTDVIVDSMELIESKSTDTNTNNNLPDGIVDIDDADFPFSNDDIPF